MIGTVLVIGGIGGLIYFLSNNDKDFGKEIKLKVESTNTKEDEKHKLNILRERYKEVFELFEVLEKSDALRVSSYENNSLKTKLKENIYTIKSTYLNNGIITNEEEKTKRLIEYLDLLIENKITIVGLNDILCLYNSSNIPDNILKGVSDVVEDLLKSFRSKEKEIDDRTRLKAEQLLNVLKNEDKNLDMIDEIKNQDEVNLYLGDNKASESDIGDVSSRLKFLMKDSNEDWDSK